MGCQKDIAAKISVKKADYVLALKGNQQGLYEDVKLFFEDIALREGCAYTRSAEKARSSIEIREYWQTGDISWLFQMKDWPKLNSIIMTRNTIKKGDKTTTEIRYFISSLKVSTDKNGKKTADEAARAIRKHWMVESYHHHLDVTFKEDANQTADKDAAYNLNIISKLALNTLKLLDVGMKNVSIRAKRYITSLNPEKYIEMILEL
jgi:predicted transposase YbfD/YdcC